MHEWMAGEIIPWITAGEHGKRDRIIRPLRPEYLSTEYRVLSTDY